jgi:DNA-binding beta-propeller fold protein YncE
MEAVARRSMLALAAISLIALAPLVAAQRQPQSSADSDSLRALVANVPLLDMERVELHPNVKLEGISSITADRAGNIYVIHRPTDPNADPVVVLDHDGKLVRSWGKGMYTIPHGVEIGPDGNVWTTDANTSKIYEFSPMGKKLLEIEVGGIPDPKADFCSITDVAFSPARPGHVFVADGYCNGRVLEYDAKGAKVQEFGEKGDGPGQFNNAHGIAVGPDGNIYVADRENGRVQWFDVSGKLLGVRTYGGQFYNIVFDSKGEMWAAVHPKGVSLDEEFQVVHFDMKTGKMLGRVPGRSHQLGIGFDGSIYPASRSENLIVYRPRK